jgi:hypothetical protein
MEFTPNIGTDLFLWVPHGEGNVELVANTLVFQDAPNLIASSEKVILELYETTSV